MAKIDYVGDWAVLMGPLFVETPVAECWARTEPPGASRSDAFQ